MVKTTYNYQGTYDPTRMARAFSSNQPASVKYSLEIGRTIRGKMLSDAVKLLEDITTQERFLPLRTYHKKVPHRRGNPIMGTKAGRYPQKTCKIWIRLLNNVRANADLKGLDTKKLQVVHATASTGFSRTRNQAQGRISGKQRKSKSAHIEIVVREVSA